jgi:hypothetical protein
VRKKERDCERQKGKERVSERENKGEGEKGIFRERNREEGGGE